MQYSYRLLYFELLPPSPFMREANKVAFSFWLCILMMAFAWSARLMSRDPLRGITTDTIIVGAIIAEIWYISLFTTSTWRLAQYNKSARQLGPDIYQLLYPWGGILVVNSTVLIFAFVDRIAPATKAGDLLYKILAGELVPFLAFEIPVVKKWFPQFEPMRFVNIFIKSLSILLGRQAGVQSEEHAKHVVEFQFEFARYSEGERIRPAQSEDSYSHYRDSTTLGVFQGTLSCLYETSNLIGDRIDRQFRGRHWTMVDVGGGEGIFTAEVLSKCSTLPYVLTMLDPSEENVREYRNRISKRFDGMRNLDTFAKPVEEVVNDLPRPNLLLASHSLYAVLDQSRGRGTQVVRQLARNTSDGMALFILSSQDSYLYTIKRTILAHLHRIDRSSYGEDLVSIFGSDLTYQVESVDSLVDMSGILDNYDKLLSWLSYFCRVDIEELRPHYDFCNALVRDTAIEVKCLPATERERIEESEAVKKIGLSATSRVIYHKEVLVSVPSERQIDRFESASMRASMEKASPIIESASA